MHARRRTVDLLILLIVLVVGTFAILYAQTIGDWVHSKTYAPSDNARQLAHDAGMSSHGTDLFYRFEPSLVDQATLDAQCSVKELGCTEGHSIYILQPANDTDHNTTVVTAAHEMLHVAFSRLDSQEQVELEPLLDAELARPAASNIVKQLADYPKEDYYNEAHSYIGSELGGISPQLEQYYRAYFAERDKSVEAYRASTEH